MKGKKILIGVSGSIAAYKIVLLVRLLIKAGAEVKIIMTEAATDFITPLTLSTLSKNPVLHKLTEGDNWANHVALGRWADIMLIAPLSANTLAKMATGICDNLLTAVYLSATCRVVVAPAMDEDMWKHPSTLHNLETIKTYGNTVINVEVGELASGLFGAGRMAEPEEIFHSISHHLELGMKLSGKKILVNAGPTYEAIDPVRFIGNRSTGKMGVSLAEAFADNGAIVTLVLGPSDLQPSERIKLVRVTTADEMYTESMIAFKDSEISVLCAAVADYKPVKSEVEKIKKTANELQIKLIKTKDILKEMGRTKKENQLLIGFALETTNEKENALKKLQDKNADMIVLNSLKDTGAGFGGNSNKITIFDKKGAEYAFDKKSKDNVATDIVNKIIEYIHA